MGGVTTVVSGPVTVRASDGAIAKDQTLTVGIHGGSVPGVRTSDLLAGLLEVTTSQGQPTGPVTISFQLAPGERTGADAPVIIHEDTETGTWLPEDTTYDPVTGIATATVTHFSGFSIGSLFRYSVAYLFENRVTDVPTCAGTPSWVVNTEFHSPAEQNEPLWTCSEARTSSSDLYLNVTNNRGYPLSLTVNGAPFTVEQGAFASTALRTITDSLQRIVDASDPHVVLLPAKASVVLHFARPTTPGTQTVFLNASRTATAAGVMLDSLMEKVLDAANIVPLQVVDCMTKTIYDSMNGAGAATQLFTIKGCLDAASGLSSSWKLKLTAIAIATYVVDTASLLSDLAFDSAFPPHAEFVMKPSGQTLFTQLTSDSSGSWCAVTSAHQLYCWGGDGGTGLLADGTAPGGFYDTPTRVSAVGSDVAMVARHGDHTCVVKTGGAVYCWGLNDRGQLGDGTFIDRFTPVKVTGLPAVVKVSAGWGTSCALTAAGQGYCWGDNSVGQTSALPDTRVASPVAVTSMGPLVAIVAGMHQHSCAVTTAGSAYCWGAWSGGLGDGSTYYANVSAPIKVTGLSSVTAIWVGSQTTCVIASGQGYCWGMNGSNGLVGNGSTDPVLTPVPLTDVSGAAKIAPAGYDNACAVTTAGAGYCWGQYELYDPTTGSTTSLVPVLQASVGGWSEIWDAGYDRCGLSTAGRLYCSGVHYPPASGIGRLGTMPPLDLPLP